MDKTMPTMQFPQLNLPPIDPARISKMEGASHIFDPLRKKWLTLTPEEWVRQHFVEWLICVKGYSPYRIANEIGIKFNTMSRRCDTVVFDKANRPYIIVEYKAPSVKISQKTFDQIVRYNMVLEAKYLIVSNGMQHYCCMIDYTNHSYEFLPEIPDGSDF